MLPDALIGLWGLSNGFSLPNGFVLYGADEIVERNRTWESSRYAPGYVVVGDDSGGRLVLMQASRDAIAAFSSDAGDLQPASFTPLGPDLIAWIESGASTEVQDSAGQVALASVDVYLDRSPPDLKDLLTIKSALGIDLSIGDMRRGVSSAPLLLAQGVPYQKFRNRVDRLPAHLQALLSLRPVAL